MTNRQWVLNKHPEAFCVKGDDGTYRVYLWSGALPAKAHNSGVVSKWLIHNGGGNVMWLMESAKKALLEICT